MDCLDNDKKDNSTDEYEGYVSPAVETKNYNDTIEPIAYDLRFTFSNQDKELECLKNKQFIGRSKTIFSALITKLYENEYFYQNRYVGGFETMNKTGENCKAHIHLRFYSTSIGNTMRRTIKRFLEKEYDEETNGNQSLMFKPKVVRDKLEFMRYPLKQGFNSAWCRGYSNKELELMYETAKDSYLKTVQINQKKMDNHDKDDTLFLRVLSKLKKDIEKNDTKKTPKDIYKAFLETYIEENKPINRTTISGYVINAQVKLNLITIDQLLEEWGI